jgi:ribosomal lysine N-methyltransferase 2
MSLHIFLHLPSEELESQDPLFGPYISILPRQFDAHPLTWVIKQRNDQNPEIIQNQLLEDLPPSVTTALENLENRFWADWKIIRKYVVSV